MPHIEFVDNSIKIEGALEEALIAGLEEAAAELQSQAEKNTPVDTGQLKGSWNHIIDESSLTATIGSPLENAIWTEFGTGEYALEGNGRKGGWFYKDAKGMVHFTYGKPPVRMLFNAFVTKKNAVIRIIQKHVTSAMK